MATQNFQIFDESLTAIDSDLEYQSEPQRINGVTPGLASPKLHNKLYRQCSVMAYAIASVLVARGFDAKDNDPAALANSIQRAFAFTVNGNKPNASGAITAVRPIDSWPVGSLFITFNNTNPATLLGGGTWVQIKGRYLLAADTGDPVDGVTTIGAHTKNVPLVSHTHNFMTDASGIHSHLVSGWTGGAGAHSHTRGSMNITGWFGADDRMTNSYGGAFYDGGWGYDTGSQRSETGNIFGFDAARSWTGETSVVGDHAHYFSVGTTSDGSHTHGGTTTSTGTAATFDVRPASIYVYMWRRTA